MIVSYAHLCEKAFLSQNGNLNLIGVIEKLMVPAFPATFPQLSLVTQLKSSPGDHQMIIKILDGKSGEEISKQIQINLKVQAHEGQAPEHPQNLRIIGEINSLTIKEAGEYLVEVHIDGKKSYEIPFSVEKHVKPIPQNR